MEGGDGRQRTAAMDCGSGGGEEGGDDDDDDWVGNGADLRTPTAVASDEYWGASPRYGRPMACMNL